MSKLNTDILYGMQMIIKIYFYLIERRYFSWLLQRKLQLRKQLLRLRLR